MMRKLHVTFCILFDKLMMTLRFDALCHNDSVLNPILLWVKTKAVLFYAAVQS